MIKNFLNVLAFLTISPINKNKMLTEEEMGRFPGYFPLVGLTIGIFLFLFYLFFLTTVPTKLAATLIVIILIIITRGFHIDAIADTADALLSHKSLEKKLEILKDSHQGTFGVIAIVLSILLKIVLLNYFLENGQSYILVLFPVWGRFAASWVAVKSKYVGSLNGLGFNIVEKSNTYDLYFAFICLFVISLFAGIGSVFCAFIIWFIACFLTYVWRKTLGGVTGDLLGATVEIAELASLLVMLILI